MTTVQVVETSVTATTASAIHAPPTYDLIWLQGSNRSQMQCYWYALRLPVTAYTVVKLLITERRK